MGIQSKYITLQRTNVKCGLQALVSPQVHSVSLKDIGVIYLTGFIYL
jgi:hypothetical protein